MALSIKSTEPQPRVFVVSLTGMLDTHTYPDLEKRLDYLIQEGDARMITLDLAALTFISSMGVRVIFKTKKNMAAKGGQFAMVHLPPPIRKVFEIINALPTMKIFTSIEDMDRYLAKMQESV